MRARPPKASSGGRPRRKPRGPTGTQTVTKRVSKKLAISLDPVLAAEVEQAAGRHANGNVSAWIADAARQRLRSLAAREALAIHEAEHGPISEAELAEARRQWPRG